MNNATEPPESERKTHISSRLMDLKHEIVILFQDTISLMKTELGENAEAARRSITMIMVNVVAFAVSGLFILAGLNLLTIALLAPDIMSLQNAAWVSTLCYGILVGIVSFVLMRMNAKKLAEQNIVPNRTLETLERQGNWIANEAKEISL